VFPDFFKNYTVQFEFVNTFFRISYYYFHLLKVRFKIPDWEHKSGKITAIMRPINVGEGLGTSQPACFSSIFGMTPSTGSRTQAELL
jgi:hypothetical protein